MTRFLPFATVMVTVQIMENREQTYSLLDLSQVDMLLEFGAEESIELFAEILELYEQESRAKFADLKSARTEAKAEAFGNAAHALAGSSANIGGYALWQNAKKMEDFCKNDAPEAAYSMLPQLEIDFEETLRQLSAYLARHA